jgi:hypothetical protein
LEFSFGVGAVFGRLTAFGDSIGKLFLNRKRKFRISYLSLLVFEYLVWIHF